MKTPEFLQARSSSRSSKFENKQLEEVFSFGQYGIHLPSLIERSKKAKLLQASSNIPKPVKITKNSSSHVINSDMAVDSQPLSISFVIQGKLSSVDRLIQIAGIVMLLLLLACTVSWIIHCADGEAEAPEAGDCAGRVDKLVKNSSERRPMGSASPPSRTREMLAESIDGNAGTWACNYRKADGQQKDALELLFRCGIIPRHEFASSCVSQEHIDECMWISMHMLRNRPLEEWVRLWPEAQQRFEESVTACFAARTDVLDTTKTDSPHMEGSAPREPYERNRASMQAGPPVLPPQMAQDMALRSKDNSGQNLLIMRCREIMGASRSEVPVQEHTAFAQTLAPVVQEAPEALPVQLQMLDAASPSPSSAQRLRLRVFEEVVPESKPREDETEASYGMAMQAQADGWWLDMQHQEESSAACSTSTFRTRDTRDAFPDKYFP